MAHSANIAALASTQPRDLIVVDLAYQPFLALLLNSPQVLGPIANPWADEVVQLWSPNKVHGMTGVRGAYLVLPRACGPASVDAAALRRLAPSWVLGADGVSLLDAHIEPDAREFLSEGSATLRAWKRALDQMLDAAGWQRVASELHYGLYRPRISEVRLRAMAPEHVEELIGSTAAFQAVEEGR